MDACRVPILVNEYERVVDARLARLRGRHDARLFPKVGLKDVLPIHGSGLDDADYTYALMAHFDFVITDLAGEGLLAAAHSRVGGRAAAGAAPRWGRSALARRAHPPAAVHGDQRRRANRAAGEGIRGRI
jgi:hypothetical protein